MRPSAQPSAQPSVHPTGQPSRQPTAQPSTVPSSLPTSFPTPVHLTTLTMEATFGFYYVASTFPAFLTNRRARTAIAATMLNMFPLYARRNSDKPSSGFKVFFTAFADLNSRPQRGLLLSREQEQEQPRQKEQRRRQQQRQQHLRLASTIDVGVTVTLKATTEIISPDVLVAYAFIRDTLVSSVLSGDFVQELKQQAVLAGDTSLLDVTMPTDPSVSSKFVQDLAKSAFPTLQPTGQPSARPSRQVRPVHAVDNTSAYVLAISLGLGLVAVAATLGLACCHGPALRLLARLPRPRLCLGKKVGSSDGGDGGARVAPAPVEFVPTPVPPPRPSALPAFSAEEEHKQAEEFEPILPARLMPRALALVPHERAPLPDLGLHGPPPRAVEAVFARKVQQRLHLQAWGRPMFVAPADSFVLGSLTSHASRRLQQQSASFRAPAPTSDPTSDPGPATPA